MKRVLALLSLFTFIFFMACNSSEEVVTEHKEGPVKGEDPPKKEAKLKVIASGRESYKDIKIYVVDENDFGLGEYLNKDGEVSFDVTDYIGKTLAVKAVETKDRIHPVSDEKKVKIENRKDIVVHLKIEKEKIYNANIRVLRNGKPLGSVKVYAIDDLKAKYTLSNVKMSGSATLGDFYAITNSNGVASFVNMPVQLPLIKYHFVVITQEPNLVAGIEGEYKEVVLDMNGTTTQSGEIRFNGTSLSVEVTSQKDISNMKVNLYKNKDYYTLKLPPIYSSEIKNKQVVFKDLKSGNYYMVALDDNNSCLTSFGEEVTVEKDKNNHESIEVYSTGKLTLMNKSSNPYDVTIIVDGVEYEIRMKGKSTNTYTVKEGNVKVKVKQLKGYLIYPTEEEYNREVACGVSSSLCFPKDRCQ